MADDDSVDEPETERPAETTGAVNVADPSSIRRVRRKKQSEEDQQLEFWTELLSTPLGRREMWGILDSGHAFQERFATGPNGFPQPEASWCEAGEQRLAFRLYLSWLRLAPDGVQLMLRENHPALLQAPKRKRD